MKTIETYYNEWADLIRDDEDVDDAFSTNSEWKGHMVKGFIQYIFNDLNK